MNEDVTQQTHSSTDTTSRWAYLNQIGQLLSDVMPSLEKCEGCRAVDSIEHDSRTGHLVCHKCSTVQSSMLVGNEKDSYMRTSRQRACIKQHGPPKSRDNKIQRVRCRNTLPGPGKIKDPPPYIGYDPRWGHLLPEFAARNEEIRQQRIARHSMRMLPDPVVETFCDTPPPSDVSVQELTSDEDDDDEPLPPPPPVNYMEQLIALSSTVPDNDGQYVQDEQHEQDAGHTGDAEDEPVQSSTSRPKKRTRSNVPSTRRPIRKRSVLARRQMRNTDKKPASQYSATEVFDMYLLRISARTTPNNSVERIIDSVRQHVDTQQRHDSSYKLHFSELTKLLQHNEVIYGEVLPFIFLIYKELTGITLIPIDDTLHEQLIQLFNQYTIAYDQLQRDGWKNVGSHQRTALVKKQSRLSQNFVARCLLTQLGCQDIARHLLWTRDNSCVNNDYTAWMQVCQFNNWPSPFANVMKLASQTKVARQDTKYT